MDHNEFSFCEVSETSLALHGAIGRALALAARFEGNCRAFETLMIVREENRKATSQEERDEILYRLSRKVWDRRLGTRPESLAARYRGLLKIDLETVLRAAVKARNLIAHDLAIGLCDRATDSDHDSRLEEVRSAVEPIESSAKACSSSSRMAPKAAGRFCSHHAATSRIWRAARLVGRTTSGSFKWAAADSRGAELHPSFRLAQPRR